MYGLTKEEKLKFIKKYSKDLNITAYEYGEHTDLSTVGAHNILTGVSKNPRSKNLDAMLDYLESKQLGKNIPGHKNYTKEPEEPIPKTAKKAVPYYNFEITNTDFKQFEDVKRHIEFFVDYQPLNDCSAYLPYYGHSMEPKIAYGNTIAVKQISNLDILLWGEAYLVITSPEANSFKVVKTIHQHQDSDKVILRAINKDYEGDIVIKKSDILSLYIIKAKIEHNE